MVLPVENDSWHSSNTVSITTICGVCRPKISVCPVRVAMMVTAGTVSEMVASTEPKNRFIAR
ncbi:hypothetical protein D3C72_2462220 [compost metagenome]